MVTHHAPQMKNWRNIIADRRVRTDVVRVFLSVMWRGPSGSMGVNLRGATGGRDLSAPPARRRQSVFGGSGITAESSPALAHTK